MRRHISMIFLLLTVMLSSCSKLDAEQGRVCDAVAADVEVGLSYIDSVTASNMSCNEQLSIVAGIATGALKQQYVIKQQNKNFKIWLTGTSVCILICIVAIMLQRNRNKANLEALQEAVENINQLRTQLQQVNNNETEALPDAKPSQHELRQQLKHELLSIVESAPKYTVPETIIQSEAYKRVKQHIADDKPIREQDSVWAELERAIHSCAPNLRANLELLTLGKLTVREWHTAMLVKCGFKPSEMVAIFGLSNGAVISRRETLCIKVLDSNMGVKTIDNIIRIL